MNQTDGHTGDITLPPRMQSALEQYRKRVWFIKISEGLLMAVFGLLVSYLAVFCLDRFLDTPAVLRTVILTAGSIGLVVLFPLKVHHWVWNHRRLNQAARLIQHRFPRFGDHLLGVIELSQGDFRDGKSRRLVEAAIRQVDAELETRNLSDAVPRPRHRQWAWAAGVPLVLVAGLMLLLPAAGGNALARWAMPWQTITRYTFVQLENDPAHRVVPYAEPFQVESTLNAGSPWKPESATARYADQATLLTSREGSSYRFEVPPQTTRADLSLRIGDARRIIQVEPRLRPALSQLSARVRLPAYLERNQPSIHDARGGTINPVRGSTVVFEAAATRALATATLEGRSQRVEGTNITTESIPVERTADYRLTWRDPSGLTPREPQLLRIEARDDAAPTVTLNNLKNNQVILSSEVLAFEIQAGDDFGVKRVGLDWQGINDPVQNPEPSTGDRIVAAGNPEEEVLTVAATFSAERDHVRPQSLRLRAFAEDYLPQRGRTYSPYLVIHVLSHAEHFKWLTEQLSKWASASQEVYEKELQLNQKNRELTALPPSALEEPGKKKEIQNQAAAETANAAKLESLIEAGREIVKEAARNEEFDAGRLDHLAGMLQKLETIAGQQMPDVAALLGQAAAAPGSMPATPPDKPGPGEPAETLQLTKQPTEQKRENPAASTPQDLNQAPHDPNAPGGAVNPDQSKPASGEPGYSAVNPTPMVTDHEPGFNESGKAATAPPSKGGLSLPTTVLKGSGGKPGNDNNEKSPASTAELVIKAVTEQQDMLDAFAKLADEMNRLLLGFENSTFVKRLKAASRHQIDLAAGLNNLDGFGVDEDKLANQPVRRSLADQQVAESETLFVIQEDMMAYAERKPSGNFTRVLEEMENVEAVAEIRNISAAIEQNEVGQSTIEAEYWADALDRYAEQLVDPPPPAGPPAEGLVEQPSLTPGLVLDVIRIIHREIKLREETRELHQTIGAIEETSYQERGLDLSQTQAGLARKTLDITDQIRDLPQADHPDLQKQIQKLSDAVIVMNEVTGFLAKPETGPATIAALSEVIEILLETARVPNAPMVANAPAASASALMLIGIGDDANQAFIENRTPDQATGTAGRNLPEEFRQGLDAYLNALEGRAN